jgi:predicted KAP-like P-loop ATPase
MPEAAMPTIEDVANQINATLGQINQNTANTAATATDIKSDTAAIRTELSDVDTHLQGGFNLLAQGLFSILEAQKLGNSIALHQVAQNNSVLCWLDNIADLLCDIKRRATRQVELQEKMSTSLERLEGIFELVHPREVVERDRVLRVKEEIAACCPPEPRPEEPCPEPCPTPEPDFYKPRGQDWHPPAEERQSGRRRVR